MRFYKLSSLILVFALLFACGRNQANNPVIGNSTFGSLSPTGQGIPIYNGNSLVGYRYHSILTGGSQRVSPGSSYQTTVNINSGSRVYVNTGAATYIEIGVCNAGIKKPVQSNSTPLNATVTFNGSAVGNGNFVASSTGALVISATPIDLQINCGGGIYHHRNAQPVYYTLFLSGSYSGNGSSVIEVDTCTNTSGAAMNCP